MFDIPAYLSRIAYAGPTEPTVETLRGLHRAHMLAVPFENLDIALGRKITVDQDALLRKIVDHRRGGFCYELNGAFAALLSALRFRVTLLSARVAREKGGEGPDFDHLTLRVDMEEPWLADVGFGECFLEPLRLQTGIEQADPAGDFRLMQIGERFQLQTIVQNGHWKPQYTFSLWPHNLRDFAGMCHYHQTAPESYFTQKSICSRATNEGRITLSDMRLIVTRKGEREERDLRSESERRSALRELFGIDLEPV